ncbi:hypothetical protein BGX23_009559 [Mortierella sp. AD031]|nr:hypothetical protein BGX23_009559 [Mortierella sp. AD031]
MTIIKDKKPADRALPTVPNTMQSGSTPVNERLNSRIDEAARKLFRTSIKAGDRSVFNALAAFQRGPASVFVPHGEQLGMPPTLTETRNMDPQSLLPVNPQSPATSEATKAKGKDLLNMPLAIQEPWLSIFPDNIPASVLSIPLPALGARIESTTQLTYCNNFLHKHLSPSSAAGSLKTSTLDPSQQAWLDDILQDEEEQNRIRWLSNRVVHEFAAESIKASASISEVVLLSPSLDQEYHRKLLNCLIADFENARLLDLDLLQGLVLMVQSAPQGYLIADDLVKFLVTSQHQSAKAPLRDSRQSLANHSYYLVLALSHILDAMVEGKVRDLRRVADHEPLYDLLTGLSKHTDPYLRHQATYALQGLLHVPNDESRRQCILRHAGNIAMGLLGVASVCKLDPIGFSDGVDHLYKAAGDAHEVATKMLEGTQSLIKGGQGISAGIKGGIRFGGRLIWYTALRELQEHIRNGRLEEFNRDVFTARCCRHLEFQWGVCLFLGQIATDPLWDATTRTHALDFLGELYRNDSLWNPDKELVEWVLHLLRQISDLSDPTVTEYARSLLRSLEKEGDDGKQTLYRNCLDGPPSPYPIKVQLPTSKSSALLA